MGQETNPARTAEDTTVAEILTTVAPPRDDTTGAHVVAAGEAFLIVIQGPESVHLTRMVLDYIEALSAQAVPHDD
jgi:3-deoxy-D-arabino-heptulosonate 7-phosphate (DAHP) synthase